MSWSELEQRLESTSGLAAVRPWSVAEPAACVPARRSSYSPARSSLDLSDGCDLDSRRRDRSLYSLGSNADAELPVVARVPAVSPIRFIKVGGVRLTVVGSLHGSQLPGRVVDIVWGGRPTSRMKAP
jgi:hypothetical protein